MIESIDIVRLNIKIEVQTLTTLLCVCEFMMILLFCLYATKNTQNIGYHIYN